MKLMRKIAALAVTAVMLITVSGCGAPKPKGNLGDVTLEDNDVYAIIKIMDYGEITAKLFPGIAPESVKRFVEFAERGYYDGKIIHRVIDNYIIQGGSLNGDGSDGNVPKNEFVPLEVSGPAYNFYGALCFAATPKKGSYAQFYIVDNNTPQDIDSVINKLTSQLGDEAISSRLLEKDKIYYQKYLEKHKAIPAEVKEKYAKVGGQYDLDGQNTVFGQVIGGWDVLEAISSVEVVSGNMIDDNKGVLSKPIDSIVIETIEIVHIEPATTTTEETTAKKSSKTTKATDKINAETLPTAAPGSDTSAPAETASESVSESRTDTLPEPDTAAETETAVSDVIESTAAEDTAPSESAETLEAQVVEVEDSTPADDGSVQNTDGSGTAETSPAVTVITEPGFDDDEIVIIEE